MSTQKSKLASLAWRLAPIAVIAAGIALIYAFDLPSILTIEWLAEQRSTLGRMVAENYLLALLGFSILYALAIATAFPAAFVLTVGAGFLFGWLIGGAVAAISATAGATVLFLAARTAIGKGLREMAGPRVSKMAEAFERNAFVTMIVLRLAPVIPFFIMNIAPAIFHVRKRDFIGACLLGILPGTFAYAYLGAGIDGILIEAQNAGRSVELSDLITPQITLAFALLAVIAALPLVVRRFLPRRWTTPRDAD